MCRKLLLALCGATVLSVLVPSAALGAGGTAVSVRVEGRTRTLLAPTTVHTHAGSITKGGAPSGACPATSAAGALDTATHHRWRAKFETSFNDYEIMTILGETEKFMSQFYWGIWVNDRYATTGACEIELRRGDQLLFAVDSVAHHEHPAAITSLSGSHVARSFKVKVVSFSDAGARKPLARARVTGPGVSAVTNSRGIAQITASHAGTLDLDGTAAGYIRAAPLRVHVS